MPTLLARQPVGSMLANQRPYWDFAQALRALRAGLGESQGTMADRTRRSQSYISQLHTGRAKPSLEFLQALRDEYGIDLDEWMKIAKLVTPADEPRPEDYTAQELIRLTVQEALKAASAACCRISAMVRRLAARVGSVVIAGLQGVHDPGAHIARDRQLVAPFCGMEETANPLPERRMWGLQIIGLPVQSVSGGKGLIAEENASPPEIVHCMLPQALGLAAELLDPVLVCHGSFSHASHIRRTSPSFNSRLATVSSPWPAPAWTAVWIWAARGAKAARRAVFSRSNSRNSRSASSAIVRSISASSNASTG